MLSTRLGLRSWIRQTAHQRSNALLLNGTAQGRRAETTLSPDDVSAQAGSKVEKPREDSKVEGWFFLDSMFPIRLGIWDLRYYIALFQEEGLVEKLTEIFKEVTVNGFEVDSVDPRIKDGGIFIKYRYFPTPGSDPADMPKSASVAPNPALVEIEQALLHNIDTKGGIPSWSGLKHKQVWRVRGKPWREDMRRYASPILRVAFEGSDVREERIWNILRPYGRIRDINPPAPVPAGTLRSATVTFERTAFATIAHNCVYGAYVAPSASNPETLTRLITAYERPIKPHIVRDWLASHPKIVFPVVVFLLGTLTYTVFDPIRAVAVQAKVMDWLDYREFAVTKWLRRNAFDRLNKGYDDSSGDTGRTSDTTVWKDRQDAEAQLSNYLSDYPSTITFVHGPAGSGKSRLLRSVLEQSDRRAIVIDCNEIYAGGSDTAMVTSLAEQTGYWPVFSFLNSVNNLIDLASVGLIGQKAGLSSSLEAQVTQILEVVAQGLRRVSASRRKEAEKRIEHAQNEEREAISEAQRREHIRRGIWHDGRVDCIAGNGVMSELGVGIERFGKLEEEPQNEEQDKDAEMLTKPAVNDKVRREREYRNVQDVGSLPVVVIKNFSSKPGKEEVCNALADWAAGLVAGHIAHVIVVSDNRENAKRLAKALPTKPLNTVALADADPASSLSYVSQKLEESGVKYEISPQETQLIERLGGRASDLETIIHKVQAGQRVEDAVEDIIQRGVAELRKNAFGDDSEDGKGLPWTRQQAWTVLKLLAQKDTLKYHQILLDFPFKGDESALRAMEHAELISITTVDGRPSLIRPGKPIHRYVFQRLLADHVFQATQDIACNELLISGAESVIKSAESELVTLKDIVSGAWAHMSGAKKANYRARYLADKMQEALVKVERLEKANVELKKVLASGEDVEKSKSKGWWVFG